MGKTPGEPIHPLVRPPKRPPSESSPVNTKTPEPTGLSKVLRAFFSSSDSPPTGGYAAKRTVSSTTPPTAVFTPDRQALPSKKESEPVPSEADVMTVKMSKPHLSYQDIIKHFSLGKEAVIEEEVEVPELTREEVLERFAEIEPFLSKLSGADVKVVVRAILDAHKSKQGKRSS